MSAWQASIACFQNLETLKKARVIIVTAGMEGALPSIVAGIVGVPVIAVPTSIGYGAGLGGFLRPALHAQFLFHRGYLQHRQRLWSSLFRHPGQPPMKILYLDPVLGISGDMAISALIDAGCPFSVLMEMLGQLPVELPSMSPEKKRKGAIEGTYFRIGESHGHLSVAEMREMIGGLRVEERVRQTPSASWT